MANLLPGYKSAIIRKEKFTKYLLDPTSTDGKHKAVVFQSALGYNAGNADDLIEQIRTKLESCPAYDRGETAFGHRYEVVMDVVGPNGKTAEIVTGWFFDTGAEEPRLTTAYVRKRKHR